MMSGPVLVTGASGTLGKELVNHFKQLNIDVISATRTDCLGSIKIDLEDRDSWKLPSNIGTIILSGAITSQAACRANLPRAKLINVQRTVELGQQAAEKGAHVIFLSTNLVFDGRKPDYEPSDPVNPLGIYGSLKAEAELQLQNRLGEELTIVRLTKVVHPAFPVLNRWYQQRLRQESIVAFDDLRIAPISIPYINRAIHQLVNRKMKGIFHLSGDWDVTYAELARISLDIWKLNEISAICPTPSSKADLDANPAHGTLGMFSTTRRLGIKPEPSLASFIGILQEIAQKAWHPEHR